MSARPEPESSSVRLATWNLDRARPGTTRASRVAEYVARQDADVWVFTESWTTFSPGADFELVAHSTARRDGTDPSDEVWVAIWSRLPGEAVKLATVDEQRTAAVLLTAPGRRPMIVYGTVLPWLSDVAGSALRGAEKFSAALEAQRADWMRLRAENAGAELCVAGDFNQDLDAAHHYGSAAGRAALAAALESSGLLCLTAGADDPVKARGGHASVDHICVTRGLVPREGGRVVAWPEKSTDRGSRLSDHFGVVATLAAGA